MVRQMIGANRLQHISNEVLRARSSVKDIIEAMYARKRKWAGHVAWMSGVLLAVIALTQLRLLWFLYVGWRYRSTQLLQIHFVLSLFCIISLFTMCTVIGFLDLYAAGVFRFSPLRNYMQSHILVALFSLILFIIGFNASWQFHSELKKKKQIMRSLRRSQRRYL
ncbi:unnamed protein product [Gongylonema pulchrum]|uniref:Cytochrome b561 domain-containing protein n=1 Tax=Gongylonema pulchrum TaxID=637853 RepID=A0A183DYB4_9BILA|nr:unnamed protein product [Gongylonema pulchrum]